MPTPYYVSPEQMMQDKAEYAKKGIAKGRSIIALEYVNGILLVAENPSASLYKISEIYDSIAFAGVDQPVSATAHGFDAQISSLIAAFDGPVAIALNGSRAHGEPGKPLSILVPTGGTSHARLAIEIALALAKATQGKVTVLHVFDPAEDTDLLRGRARRLGSSVLVDARRLGKRSGVRIDAITEVNARPEVTIRRAASAGHYDLMVLGASLRLGDRKFLGSRSAALVQAIRTPILLIAQ